MLPVVFIIFIVIIVIALIAIIIKICSDNCETDDVPTRNPQWNTYNDYERNNAYTTGNDYVTNNEIYETREVEIPMERDFNITHTLTHHTETTAAGGLASDIGSTFSDMFSSGGGFDSEGGFDSGGGDTGGGFDSGGGDTGGSSYD